ncbi:HAD family hydrolase [bacterium]|nr:HAD family hydrolase [bacterium]MBU4362495.1 HAD family hydrolase [bacterium]MBU4602517.1 HAD family hydrolase [bacterium]MCG2761848.1 HAD family hydrolase [Candidatus Atribacteria bacterium]MCG2821997.1 HAD family hydrolase [Candidatus Atribacteria bacterium]
MGKLNNDKTKKYKAIFFDFGGTLMCAESDNVAHLHMMKEVIQKYNLPASPENMVIKYNSYLFTKEMTLLDTDPEEKSFTPLRESTKKAFKGVLAEYNIQPSKEDFQWLRKSFLENHKKYIKLFPETLLILRELKNTDLHMGIISDIDNDFQEFQFEVFGISEIFDSITTSEEVQSYKPELKIFQAALDKARCQGEESIIIGDSYKKDIVGGKNMGMTTIWINKFQPDNIDTETADFTVTHLKEISPILKELINK